MRAVKKLPSWYLCLIMSSLKPSAQHAETLSIELQTVNDIFPQNGVVTYHIFTNKCFSFHTNSLGFPWHMGSIVTETPVKMSIFPFLPSFFYFWGQIRPVKQIRLGWILGRVLFKLIMIEYTFCSYYW